MKNWEKELREIIAEVIAETIKSSILVSIDLVEVRNKALKEIQDLIDQKEKEQKERFKKIVEDNLKVFNKEGLVAINNSLNNI